jgi:HAD superfamily hydrolase (TIGR01509 family)
MSSHWHTLAVGFSVRIPEAVLFDLDGTLLESEHLWLQAEQLTMATWDIAWSANDQKACLGGPLERVVAYMNERIPEGLRGLRPTPSEISQILITNIVHLFATTAVHWRPGAREIAQETHLLGIPTAIVTASWRVLLDAVEVNMSQEVGQFTVSIAGDEVLLSKPDPFPYQEASRRLNVDVHACLAIEDSPTGVESAVAAGARTIAVQHITPITTPGAVVINSLSGRNLEELWSLACDSHS